MCVCVKMCVVYMYTYNTHMCTYIHTHTQVSNSTDQHNEKESHVERTNTHIYIYIYIYIHAHTYAHIHTHTHTQVSNSTDQHTKKVPRTNTLLKSTGTHQHKQASVLNIQEGPLGSILTCAPGAGFREFRFDCVVGEQSGQKDVYANAARKLVMEFVNGRNSCMLAYGQVIYVHMSVCVRIYVCVCVCEWAKFVYACVWADTICAYVCVYVYMSVCVCMQMRRGRW